MHGRAGYHAPARSLTRPRSARRCRPRAPRPCGRSARRGSRAWRTRPPQCPRSRGRTLGSRRERGTVRTAAHVSVRPAVPRSARSSGAARASTTANTAPAPAFTKNEHAIMARITSGIGQSAVIRARVAKSRPRLRARGSGASSAARSGPRATRQRAARPASSTRIRRPGVPPPPGRGRRRSPGRRAGASRRRPARRRRSAK